MLLPSTNALVFAATGAIGAETARALAREGAHVWLSGRDSAAVDAVAEGIRAAGGKASTDVVDATDPAAVASYVERVAAAERIDIAFNAIGGRPADLCYPQPAADMSLEDFLTPLRIIAGSTFLTARAAAPCMAAQGGGAIVTLSSTLTAFPAAHMANITAACGAIEAMTKSLAGEFGPAGVRVNGVRANAMPETRTIQETGAAQARLLGRDPDFGVPPLGRPITVAETADTVVYLASSLASGMTGHTITVDAGAFVH